MIKYNFIKISEILEQPANTIVGECRLPYKILAFNQYIGSNVYLALTFFPHSDVIGVCRQFGEVQEVSANTTGKKLKKRDLALIDDS